MRSRPYVAPADIYARYERSGLVKYTRDDVLAAAAEIDGAVIEMESAESEAAALVIAARSADESKHGHDPLWESFAEQYHPELATILGLLDNEPSTDWGGTGGNLYPVLTWQKKATAIRRYAARLRTAVARVNTTSRKTAA